MTFIITVGLIVDPVAVKHLDVDVVEDASNSSTNPGSSQVGIRIVSQVTSGVVIIGHQ